MASDADGPRRIRPVAYQETDSRFPIVNNATSMGKALVEQCDLAILTICEPQSPASLLPKQGIA